MANSDLIARKTRKFLSNTALLSRRDRLAQAAGMADRFAIPKATNASGKGVGRYRRAKAYSDRLNRNTTNPNNRLSPEQKATLGEWKQEVDAQRDQIRSRGRAAQRRLQDASIGLYGRRSTGRRGEYDFSSGVFFLADIAEFG
jgi:hypothetical protein